MKVVVAIDSLKGSLSSMEAGMAIKEGIHKACEAEVIVKPLADGGEGTVDALLYGMGGYKVKIEATGPLNDKISCSYGILKLPISILSVPAYKLRKLYIFLRVLKNLDRTSLISSSFRNLAKCVFPVTPEGAALAMTYSTHSRAAPLTYSPS